MKLRYHIYIRTFEYQRWGEWNLHKSFSRIDGARSHFENCLLAKDTCQTILVQHLEGGTALPSILCTSNDQHGDPE